MTWSKLEDLGLELGTDLKISKVASHVKNKDKHNLSAVRRSHIALKEAADFFANQGADISAAPP